VTSVHFCLHIVFRSALFSRVLVEQYVENFSGCQELNVHPHYGDEYLGICVHYAYEVCRCLHAVH
jgi:hypothetical protein